MKMMKTLFKLSSVIASIITNGVLTTCCVNDPLFRIDNDPDKPCSWLRYGPNKNERRETYCTTLQVYSACPQSCGECCEDDPSYEFKIKSKKIKDCQWLSKKKSRQNKWCGRSDREFGFKTYQDGRMIRDACPVACDMCYDDNEAVEPTTFKLTTLDASTFNPVGVPICFDTFGNSPIDDSTFSDMVLVVTNKFDDTGEDPLMTTSDFIFSTDHGGSSFPSSSSPFPSSSPPSPSPSPISSSGFCAANLNTFEGLMSIGLYGTHVPSGNFYSFYTSIWAGEQVATLCLVEEGSTSPFTGNVTITAQSGDDSNVTSTVYSTDGSGVVTIESLPDRTVLFSAVTEDGKDALTALVGGGENTITLYGFIEPVSDFVNFNFSTGLDGWVTPSWITNTSNHVKVVEHEEDIGPQRRKKRRIQSSLKDHRDNELVGEVSTTSSTLSKVGAPMPKGRTLAFAGNNDLELSTNGIGEARTSQSYETDPKVFGITIRFAFETKEVPANNYGSDRNDYFSISVKAESTGAVVSFEKAMNEFDLSDFDFATGSTDWIEKTLILDLDYKNGDSIQVDLMVANMVDDQNDSKITVDFIEEVVSNIQPFESKDDFIRAMQNHRMEGWKDSEEFIKYGPIEAWDVSKITDMNRLFKASSEIPDIGDWDVSSVTDFGGMFMHARQFDIDLSSWKVGKGTDFSYMFFRNYKFDSDISGWDVSSGEDFRGMFYDTEIFEQNLCEWELSCPTSCTTIPCPVKPYCIERFCPETKCGVC